MRVRERCSRSLQPALPVSSLLFALYTNPRTPSRPHNRLLLLQLHALPRRSVSSVGMSSFVRSSVFFIFLCVFLCALKERIVLLGWLLWLPAPRANYVDYSLFSFLLWGHHCRHQFPEFWPIQAFFDKFSWYHLLEFYILHGSEIVNDATAHVPRIFATCSLLAFFIGLIICPCSWFFAQSRCPSLKSLTMIALFWTHQIPMALVPQVEWHPGLLPSQTIRGWDSLSLLDDK